MSTESEDLEKTLKLVPADEPDVAATPTGGGHLGEAVSVAGLRGHNEDAALVLSGTAAGLPVSLVAVADGMGGHAHGEVASALALDALRDRWRPLLAELTDVLGESPEAGARPAREALHEAFVDADRRVADYEGGGGMGTTLVAAVVVGDRVLFANVGDSRGYLLGVRTIQQVTVDHSVVAEAILKGGLTPEEAANSPYKHALTRSVDGTGDGAPDLFPPDGGWLKMGEGAVIVLGSDGLYGPLSETDLLDVAERTPNPQTAATALVARALDRGSDDNVTAVVLEVGAFARRPEMLPASALDGVGLSVSEPAPSEDDVLAGIETRRAGRTPWALGALALVLVGAAIGLWWSQTRPEARIEATFAEGEFSWTTVDGEAAPAYRITLYDVGAVTPDSGWVEAPTSPVPLSAFASDWSSGVIPPGNYRWRVEALHDDSAATPLQSRLYDFSLTDTVSVP